MKLDKEEKEILDAYESGEMPLEKPSDALLEELARAGESTFKKDKRINIRLSSHDLLGIQRKASRKGVPYQAFIAGLIHQYVQGDLLEKTGTENRVAGAITDSRPHTTGHTGP